MLFPVTQTARRRLLRASTSLAAVGSTAAGGSASGRSATGAAAHDRALAEAEQEVAAAEGIDIEREGAAGGDAEKYVVWRGLPAEIVVDGKGDVDVDVDEREEFNDSHFWRLEDASVDLDFV
jgi:hypothetical protein